MDMSTVKTLNQEEEVENQSAQKNATISFPIEIIEDILSRLPVKSLLRFRSVSKQWLSLISDDPCFHKLHFTRSLVRNDRTSFFVSSYNKSTRERHFFSAPRDGGPLTKLMTLNDAYDDYTEVEHLNGLVLFTSMKLDFDLNYAFIVNPATRKVFRVPPPFNIYKYCRYFFGFDKSNTEHKILSIGCTRNPKNIELMMFSLSTYSGRQIFVDLEELPRVSDMIRYIRRSVCVNSVIHFRLYGWYEILAFDLTTEKFSIINLPEGAIPRANALRFTRRGKHILKSNMPFLIKDNELLGVVCHDLLVETNEIHIWILQDYVNRIWVRETVTSSKFWIELDDMEIMDDDMVLIGHQAMGIIGDQDMENLVFPCPRLSRDMVNAFNFDMKTKTFKLVSFNLGCQFLHSETQKFRQVRSSVESIFPLRQEFGF